MRLPVVKIFFLPFSFGLEVPFGSKPRDAAVAPPGFDEIRAGEIPVGEMSVARGLLIVAPLGITP